MGESVLGPSNYSIKNPEKKKALISWNFYFIYFLNRLEYLNSKYLQKILLREYDQSRSSIVLLYEKLERKHAIELAEAGQLIHTPSSTSLL